MKTLCTVLVAFALTILCGAARSVSRTLRASAAFAPTQLVGYGLVVGLDGSGDTQSNLFTAQSVASMLEKFGVTLPTGALKVRNVAAVMVTCDLPAFARNGGRWTFRCRRWGCALYSAGDAGADEAARRRTAASTPWRRGRYRSAGIRRMGGFVCAEQEPCDRGRVPSGALVEREVPTTR